MRTAATATILLAAILFAPTALALSYWTGNFLRAADNVPIHYNGDSGQTNVIGSAIPPGVCSYFTTLYEQCGQCVYLPTNEDWRPNVTQFRWGRCVSADLTEASAMVFRGDIRIEDGGPTHELRGQVEYVDVVQGFQTVIDTDPIWLPRCDAASLPIGGGQSASFSACVGLAWSTPFPTGWPVETDLICLRLESWFVEPGNEYAEETARRCRSIAS